MTWLIICALVLALLQFWIIPMLFNLHNFNYLLSSRDEPAPEDSVKLGRTRRAAVNLQESLPAFLALAILSIVLEVDNTDLAMWWLGFRAAFVVSYILGITYVRTLLWAGSLVCLVMMAIALL
ncbi:MAG: MAPEG family protein [Pseudomonadota bacterium]|nr:MAPEG family protein [Pseudomonadota bacterium]